MAIKAGEEVRSDDVMNAFGITFKNQANLLWNANLIGFDSSLTTNFQNLDYDVFSTDSMAASGNVYYDSTNDLYFGGPWDNVADYTSYDECNDSSVDGTKWTTGGGGTVTENTNTLNISAASGLSTTVTASADTIDLTTTPGTFIDINLALVSANTGNGSGCEASAAIKLGTQTLYSKSVSGANREDIQSNLRIQIFYGSSVRYYRTKEDTDAWSSWSQTTQGGQIAFDCSGKGDGGFEGSGRINIDNIRYNTATDGTGTITSSGITISSATTNAIATYYSLNDVSLSLSSDGTNFENATDAQIHRFTNTGTDLKIRFTFTTHSEVKNYAICYNWY